MSTSSLSDHPTSHSTPLVARSSDDSTARARPRSTWLISLTAICFLFGGLTAMQLRAIETVRDNRAKATAGLSEQQALVSSMQSQLSKEANDRAKTERLLKETQAKLAQSGTLTQKQVNELNSEITRMRLVAGLTPASGPGIVLTLKDDPETANVGAELSKAGGLALPSEFAPGLVHDFDVLQTVNELRAAKAEAIAINGTRITAYTPIRCVGPTILINWEPAAAPFVITAIGDPDRLASAVSMPGGIVENLRKNTLGVEVSKSDDLKVPAAEGVPTMRDVKVEKS